MVSEDDLFDISKIFLFFIEKLFGCFKDCNTCCYGYWCTPCLFGSNAEKIDDSNCVVMCCVYSLLAQFGLCFIPHMMKRKKLREKYNLKEDPCADCPTTFFCSPCGLCQEAREIKLRGKIIFIFKKKCFIFFIRN
jgi:Cys-rich protein (TIGR01571 family)